MDNRKNYDSTFCGSLPLHLINHVQPYGVLIVLDRSNYNIIQVSENIETAIGINVESIINTSIEKYIKPEEVKNLQEKFSTDITAKVPLPLTFTVNNAEISFLAVAHAKNNSLVLELEKPDKDAAGFLNIYQEVKYAMAAINLATTTEEICNTAITELKKLSGFDRIMVYQFDEDWNGIVIAETLEEGMEPYLGLRFPASDIPKQARDLYFKNPYRLIPSREYTPVKIYPVINPVSHSFIDLSNCNLRSVVAVHIEYLKNMNVMASMSTAIIKDEKLWGLIACHHRTAKYLSYEKCSQFELLSGMIASRLSSIQAREELEESTKLQHIQAELIKQVYAEQNIITGLINKPVTVLDILQAEGAAIAYNKRLETFGKTPEKSEIKDLIFWLETNVKDKAYTFTDLAAKHENSRAYAEVASGIIVLPIHAEKGEFIIGFRPEAVEKINWGGNPNEAINFEKDNIKYHPRNSFKVWQQEVKNTSLPWNKQEVAIAESFRNFVIEYLLKKAYATV